MPRTSADAGSGGGGIALTLRSWNPTASVRMSESGGCATACAASGSLIITSTSANADAAASNCLRSNALFAAAYRCWMIPGSIRRRTSASEAPAVSTRSRRPRNSSCESAISTTSANWLICGVRTETMGFPIAKYSRSLSEFE